MPQLSIPLEVTHPARHDNCRNLLWRLGADGAGCRVAVIDSGVDPDWLANQVLPRASVTAHDFTAQREGWRETKQPPHGSRIVADIVRSAPGATIESLRVQGASDVGSREEAINALEWCGRNGVAVANLSFSAYSGCSQAAPCALCRTINTVGLSSDVFVVAASGDAFTAGEQVDRGDPPLACPAWNTFVGMGIGSSEIVTDPHILFQRKGGGLSFTTGKATAGLAQVRGAFPKADLFTVRRCLECTCVPSPHVPAKLGLGRHCFVLAWLALGGLGLPTKFDLAALSRPSERTKQGVDETLLNAMRFTVRHFVLAQNWGRAREIVAKALEIAAPWGGPAERALALHVRASCHEALGEDQAAGEDYEAAEACLHAWLSADAPGGTVAGSTREAGTAQ